MERQSFVRILVLLLLIQKSKHFNNSYTLVKILSRRFNIIDHEQLLNNLISEELISRSPGIVGKYEVLESGFLNFQHNQDSFSKSYKSFFPDQAEFIELLLNNALG